MDNEARLQRLEAFMQSLQAGYSLPISVQNAIQSRLGTGSLSVSAKSASSENQAVDEGGTAEYNVLKAPDGFLQNEVNGITYYLPYFS